MLLLIGKIVIVAVCYLVTTAAAKMGANGVAIYLGGLTTVMAAGFYLL